jgi:hypothetical protein
METATERPATVQGGEPLYVVSRAANQKIPSRPRTRPQWLAFKLAPDGHPIRVTGRLAQTLALLVKVGPAGFTSGEASPLHWARRTSHYIRELRRLGVPIATQREAAGDAVIGRYILTGPVSVIDQGEGAPW